MPAIAAWALSLIRQIIPKISEMNISNPDLLIIEKFPEIRGIIPFSEGALLSAMFLTAVTVYLIEKDFLKAFFWTIPLILFSFLGLIHSSVVGFAVGGMIPLGYIFFGSVILIVFFYNKYSEK